jgi:hypothetical protein
VTIKNVTFPWVNTAGTANKRRQFFAEFPYCDKAGEVCVMISYEKIAPTSRPNRHSWNLRYLAIIYCHATYSISGTKLSTRNTAAILCSSDILLAKRSLSWRGSYRKRNAAMPNCSVISTQVFERYPPLLSVGFLVILTDESVDFLSLSRKMWYSFFIRSRQSTSISLPIHRSQ